MTGRQNGEENGKFNRGVERRQQKRCGWKIKRRAKEQTKIKYRRQI